MKNSPTFPLPGSVMYPFVFGTREERKKSLALFKKMNRWLMVPLLRVNFLQIFGIGFIFLLLRTRGRKSGKIRYTPLEYRKDDDYIYIFSSRGKRSNWFRNLLANPNEVRIKIHFFWKRVSPEVITSYEEKMKIIEDYTAKYPRSAKGLFGFDRKRHRFTKEGFRQLVEYIEIVRFPWS